jgi:hypothetical protein
VDNLLELLVLLMKSSVSQESESNIEGKVGYGAIDKNKSVPFFEYSNGHNRLGRDKYARLAGIM